ncbi:MAG: hypothetical protein E6Q88_04910 [Lysobacteraceae bacterium]|nr:MAG: hypothetical protein E6Q88_04910 [Xanthomonadaceae bacterium]
MRLINLDTRTHRRLAFALLVAITALSPLHPGHAQSPESKVPATDISAAAKPLPKDVLVLGCCRCTGGINRLDLSTVAGVPWTVSYNSGPQTPAVILPTPHPLWNLPTGGAQWVSASALGTSGVPAGTYTYRLKFYVPKCTIPQRVVLSGQGGADDGFKLYLDSNPTPISACSGGWCFNTANPTAPFAASVGFGLHTLTMSVVNTGGPSGMFLRAALEGRCTDSLTQPEHPGQNPN